jgi:hypothetical protein
VELVWVGSAGNAALKQISWGFAPGHAPPQLTTELTVSPGSYQVQLRVERGAARTTVERTVIFEADEAEALLSVP